MSFRPLSLLGFVFGALAGVGPRIGDSREVIAPEPYIADRGRRLVGHNSHGASGAAAAKRAAKRRRNIAKHPRGAA